MRTATYAMGDAMDPGVVGVYSRCMRRLRLVVVPMIMAAVTIRGAAAGSPTSKDKPAAQDAADVETAEQFYAKLDYDRANEVAERVVKQRGLSHTDLVRAYRVLAVTNAILDKEERSREAFLQLLVVDPEYTVDPNLGPKVSTPFIEARGQFRSLSFKPGIDVVANLRMEGGQLRVTTRDPTHIVKKVAVGYRWTPSGDFAVAPLPVGESTVEVVPAPPGRTRLDFTRKRSTIATTPSSKQEIRGSRRARSSTPARARVRAASLRGNRTIEATK